MRTYGYDAFGNRTHMTEGDRETTYTYNAMNQLMSRMDSMIEETYAYDRRGNLSLIMENGSLKNSYTYGALNRLEQAVNSNGESAAYEYNGLGHRVGVDSEIKIRYTIDLTRGYHNLLEKEEAGSRQTYLWDGNVAGMREEKNGQNGWSNLSKHPDTAYYLQDELGSLIRLLDEEGNMRETYGYDEFGQDLYRNQGQIQPFGYTGYQSDRIAETYYAQTREYRAELGRFAGVDIIKGFAAAPYTLNEYGYCYNMPLKYFDKSGNIPEEKAQEIISKNSEYIIKYAEMYDVDPYVVAGCIYVEQVTNVDWIDSLDSTIAIKTDLDTSIGVGQVKVSTARLLEDEGYVEKTTATWYEKLFGMDRNAKIAAELEDEEKNICYVAAYLRYQTDIWEKEYPEITEDVAVLGTLYNLGHEKRGEGILGYIFGFGNAPRTPHSNPETNSFGNDVEAYYDLIGKLLESECVE